VPGAPIALHTLIVEQRGTAHLEGLRLGRQIGSHGTLTVAGTGTSASTLTYGGSGTDFIIGEVGPARSATDMIWS
jgi:hypothetical protein